MDAATSTRDQKKFWILVKSVVDVQSVPPLEDNYTGDFVFSDVDKAIVLNEYFASYQQPCITHCPDRLPSVLPATSVSFAVTSTVITTDDVLSALR